MFILCCWKNVIGFGGIQQQATIEEIVVYNF